MDTPAAPLRESYRTREPLREPLREPWRRRLVRTLLYGRNVDRTAKARARIGLAILVFAIGYAVIAARLVMFATAARRSERAAHRRARRGGDRAARHPRSQRRNPGDRRAHALAVRRAAPHHRRRRGVRAAHRGHAGRSMPPSCANGSPPSAASSGSSARSRPSSASEIHRLGLPGIGFLPENKRVYPNGAEVSHLIGHVNIDNQGIAGIEKWLDRRGLADLHLAGLATDRLQKPVELAVDLRVQHALRDELVAARDEIQGDGRGRPAHRRAHRRDRRDGVGARLRPQQSARGARPDPHQPPHHRRVRDGLDLQGAHAGDGARFRQDHAQVVARRTRAAAIRQVHHPRFPRAEPRADGARDLHLFLQHRHRAHGGEPRGRAPQGVPARRSASSTGCAPNCRRAPSRWCPSAGSSSTP